MISKILLAIRIKSGSRIFQILIFQHRLLICYNWEINCLPTNHNKKLAVHKTIKDIESNIKSSLIENQTKIRNIVIPQLHKLLHIKNPKNAVDDKLISMTNYTKNFCQKNRNIIFTRADNGNVTVALNKNTYLKEMENALQDKNTYSIVKKDPSISVEKKN